jgi:hypothetical protein
MADSVDDGGAALSPLHAGDGDCLAKALGVCPLRIKPSWRYCRRYPRNVQLPACTMRRSAKVLGDCGSCLSRCFRVLGRLGFLPIQVVRDEQGRYSALMHTNVYLRMYAGARNHGDTGMILPPAGGPPCCGMSPFAIGRNGSEQG